jgi:hypothetical protein
MEKFGEYDQPDIAERGITNHGAVDQTHGLGNSAGNFRAVFWVGLINLNAGGKVSLRHGIPPLVAS